MVFLRIYAKRLFSHPEKRIAFYICASPGDAQALEEVSLLPHRQIQRHGSQTRERRTIPPHPDRTRCQGRAPRLFRCSPQSPYSADG